MDGVWCPDIYVGGRLCDKEHSNSNHLWLTLYWELLTLCSHVSWVLRLPLTLQLKFLWHPIHLKVYGLNIVKSSQDFGNSHDHARPGVPHLHALAGACAVWFTKPSSINQDTEVIPFTTFHKTSNLTGILVFYKLYRAFGFYPAYNTLLSFSPSTSFFILLLLDFFSFIFLLKAFPQQGESLSNRDYFTSCQQHRCFSPLMRREDLA